jgi:alpha-amylase/alpha-mannosidase (GH57 family)
MARYVCIHGHFYQPPRENPWTAAIEAQPGAYPYHDWNARLAAECYAPNAASRILDGDGRIARIVNNYARISFDFGPTLLSWLAAEEPAIYRAVLAADRDSRERFSGHGQGMAQAYNHVILPLANRRDKQTQVLWGLRDFERRFGRPAAGMWLPETAVDLESLDLMAAHGVRFTVLEPHQALRVRPLAGGGADAAVPEPLAPDSGGGAAGHAAAQDAGERAGARAGERAGERGGGGWRAADGGRVDTTRPYAVSLPSGRRIAVFFYDGPLARAVAFEGLLGSGARFAERLLAGAPADGEDRLVHIATDGETYGHHHRHGEMALSYALDRIEAGGEATLTSYGEYLATHPPIDEVEIVESSSWSCSHGVDRWREDCGCSLGGHPGWTQAWRAPLRQALDELRDELATLYEQAAGEIFASPWAARDDYIAVVLDRSASSVDDFLARQARGQVPCGDRRVRALALLEMQRHAMLMYTSCGWFFDDLAGIEALQVLRYAGRAAQLADELFGGKHERALLRRLARARSNDPKAGSGRDLYEARVVPARLGPRKSERFDRVLSEAAAGVEDQLREIFRQQAPLMRRLAGTGTPLPAALRVVADFMVIAELRRALEDPESDPQEIARRLEQAGQLGVPLGDGGLAYALERSLTALVVRLREHPDEPRLLARAAGRAALARSAPFPVDLWRAQNLCHELRETVYLPRREAAGASGQAASAWIDLFRQLADRLSIRVE